MTLPVAILAGGLATRLRPLTEKIPKALVEIAGKPFIVHQLVLLKRQGIERVVLCVGYLGEMIGAVVGNGEAFGLQVEYSHDGPVLLGTGGSLRNALPLLGDSFFVLYGDSYLDCDYQEVQHAFERVGKPALMTVLKNENQWDRSNIIFRHNTIISYDKNGSGHNMIYIDYGLSVLNREVLAPYREGEVFDLADLFRDLVDRGQMAGHEVHERFYEIGSAKGIEDTRKLLESAQ